MSLTKKDKEDIKKIVLKTIGEYKEMLATEKDLDAVNELPDFDKWKKEAIDTGMGFVVAPEDFKLGDKEYFTWDEAKEIEKKYLIPRGWRLPTPNEFVMLYGKYGIDEDGDDDAEAFREVLNMELKGWKDEDGSLYNQGSSGDWWSTAATSATNAYNLGMLSSDLNPQNSSNQAYGFALRCVSTGFPEQSLEENQ